MSAGHDVTELLRAWSNGDAGAGERLMPLVYGELRRRAAAYLRRERPDHTLQPTALVHEAYLLVVAGTASFLQSKRPGLFAEAVRAHDEWRKAVQAGDPYGGPQALSTSAAASSGTRISWWPVRL